MTRYDQGHGYSLSWGLAYLRPQGRHWISFLLGSPQSPSHMCSSVQGSAFGFFGPPAPWGYGGYGGYGGVPVASSGGFGLGGILLFGILAAVLFSIFSSSDGDFGGGDVGTSLGALSLLRRTSKIAHSSPGCIQAFKLFPSSEWCVLFRPTARIYFGNNAIFENLVGQCKNAFQHRHIGVFINTYGVAASIRIKTQDFAGSLQIKLKLLSNLSTCRWGCDSCEASSRSPWHCKAAQKRLEQDHRQSWHNFARWPSLHPSRYLQRMGHRTLICIYMTETGP